MKEAPTLEERLAALEKRMDEVVAGLGSPGSQAKDWRATVGMFAGDPLMGEIQEEGRKIREADRKQSPAP